MDTCSRGGAGNRASAASGFIADYGTHSLRRIKASIIYKATENLRAVQILLGHAKIESTVRYLGVDVEDALEL
ncbi:tyrosine-type recombinase/integrase [Sphingomonas sp. 4RDLI-65]|uniref:tyrosine-type recombinase/integrase n=1 Tax=Sphingomonas sp. 4RDLI-65 TaxID=3111641 RepID=UPI003C2B74C2